MILLRSGVPSSSVVPLVSRSFAPSPAALRRCPSVPRVALPRRPSASLPCRAMATQYRLKDVSSLDLNDGQMQEAQVEGIEEGKVLLVKSLGRIHAVSPKCTHYGAPLKNGVVSREGRLRCPWHGACFNVGTGDVEDAPALDPIATFEVSQRDGSVFITGEERTIKANRRDLNISCSPQGQEKLVVVGG